MALTPHSIWGRPSPPSNAGEDFWYTAKEVLKAAGWVHWASGDGTSFSVTPGNVNDQITSVAEMAVNNAWYVLRDPGSRRQILVQHGTVTGSFRVYYSALDTFVGTGFGAISATVPPSATDQQQIMGTAGGYSTLTYTDAVFHFMVESAAFAGNVYPFWCTVVTEATDARSTVFFSCEAMDSGSYASADADPCIWHCGNYADPTSTASSPWFGWYKMNLAGESWVRHTLCGYRDASSVALAPDGMITPETHSANWPMPPVPVVSSGASNAWKGYCRHIRWDVGYDNNADRYTLPNVDGGTMVVMRQFYVPTLVGRRG